jgi:hypothetical protein
VGIVGSLVETSSTLQVPRYPGLESVDVNQGEDECCARELSPF